VDAVGVTLAWLEALDVDVPNEVRPLLDLETLFVALLVE
jgi:hypothetical protein